MEIIKAVSTLLSMLVVVVGAGNYMYNLYQQPDYSHGKDFTNAWLEYGDNQNVLHVEFIPNGKGNIFAALGEAITLTADKAAINPKIDNKPLLVIALARYKTDLVEVSRVVILAKTYRASYNTLEERVELLKRTMAYEDVTYNKTKIMKVDDNGTVTYMDFNNNTTNMTQLINQFRTSHPQSFEG
jgi:hypothetical protein